MWGFWKGGPAVFSVNLVVDLIGGLAKFNFKALRLPEGENKATIWSELYQNAQTKGEEWASDKQTCHTWGVKSGNWVRAETHTMRQHKKKEASKFIQFTQIHGCHALHRTRGVKKRCVTACMCLLYWIHATFTTRFLTDTHQQPWPNTSTEWATSLNIPITTTSFNCTAGGFPVYLKTYATNNMVRPRLDLKIRRVRDEALDCHVAVSSSVTF